jgi:regulator of replication initiation timing
MAIAKVLERTLHNVYLYARKKSHEYVTVEHLLLFLLDDDDAKQVLQACRADTGTLKKQLVEFIEENSSLFAETEEIDPQPTLGFQRVIQRAIMHVQVNNLNAEVNGANCLVALFGEKDTHAVYYLIKQGVKRIDVVGFLSSGKAPSFTPAAEPTEAKLIEAPIDSIQAAIDKTKSIAKQDSNKSVGLKVFISYSHTDARCLDRLLVHLRPLERKNLVDAWSDKKLRTGDKWQQEIESRLQDSAVAVILVSADFLASDFIVNDELPPLLVKAESKGLRIIPVILKPCGFLRDNVLRSFQSANDPLEPLLGMTDIQQEALYDKVASEIHSEILLRSGVSS